MMSVFGWLVTYLIHSTLLLSAAWVCDRFFLRNRPHWKELVWRVALVGGLVTATAQAAMPFRPYGGTVSLAGLEEKTEPSIVGLSPVQTIVIQERHAPRTVVISRQMESAQRTATMELTRVFPWRAALGAWAIGAALLLGALGLSWNTLRKRLEGRRRLESEAMGDVLAELAARRPVVRAPLISATEELTVPVAFGFRRPEIVLPERVAFELSTKAQESVLAHELGHIVRRDPLFRLLVAIFVRIFFFQPLNVVAARKLAAAAELLADDWAAERTARPLDLAECLTKVARWAIGDTQSTLVPAMALGTSELRQRVERLVKGEWLSMRTRKTVWAGPIATLLLTGFYLLAPNASGVAEAKDKLPRPFPAARPAPVAPPAPPAPPARPGRWTHMDVAGDVDQDEPCEAKKPAKKKHAHRERENHSGDHAHPHFGRDLARWIMPPIPVIPRVVVEFDDSDMPEPPEPPEPPELDDMDDADDDGDMAELEQNLEELREQMGELRAKMRNVRQKAKSEALESARAAMEHAKQARKEAEKAHKKAEKVAADEKRRAHKDDDDDNDDNNDDDDNDDGDDDSE